MSKKPIFVLQKRKFHMDRIYLRNYYLLLFSVILLILLQTIPLFYIFENVATQIVFSDSSKMLEQTGRETSFLVDASQRLCQQVYNDDSIKKLMYYNPPSEREKVIGLQQLANYQHIMRFTESIYVYNASQQTIYLSTDLEDYGNKVVPVTSFTDTFILEMINNYKQYQSYRPVPRIVSWQDSSENTFYSFFGYNFIDKSADNQLLCAVIVNVSSDWVQNLSYNQDDPDSETLIVDESGHIVSNSKNYPMMSSLLDDDFWKQIEKSKQNGYLITKIEGVRTFLAYTAPDRLGWQYLRIIPYNQITRDIIKIRNTVIWVAMLVLAAGSLIMLILNHYYYKPFDKIKVNLAELQTKMRRSSPELKQNFLRQQLLENQEEKTQLLLDAYKAFDITFNAPFGYRVAIISIDDYACFIYQYSPDDRNLYKFAIQNIACEIVSEHYLAESVDMHENRLAIILNNKNKEDLSCEMIMNLMRKIHDAVAHYLKLSITFAISRKWPALKNLPQCFAEAAEVLHYRLVKGQGSILFAESLELKNDEDYLYSERKEKQILDHLMHCNLEKAKEVYLEIINECTDYSWHIQNITISRLELFFNDTLNKARYGKSDQNFVAIETINISFSLIETLEQVNQEFYKIMAVIISLIEAGSSSKSNVIVSNIDHIIHLRYGDPCIGIESIAKDLGLSVSYTGRLYKQVTQITILEKLMAVRMENAREILAKTKDPIATISAKVGFASDTYFYKIFKQENGMTPAEYRKRMS